VVCVNSDVSGIETHFAGGSDFPFNAMGWLGVGGIGITGIAAPITSAAYRRPPRARSADQDQEAAGEGLRILTERRGAEAADKKATPRRETSPEAR